MDEFDLVIRNGTVVTESGIFITDIGISNEKIAVVGKVSGTGETEIDATGKIVIPGVIDAHTHLRLQLPGMTTADDFETGTKAAACGGVTTVIDFTRHEPGMSLHRSVAERRNQADGKVAVDYALHAVITSWDETIRRELHELVDYGVTSFKLFMIYRERGWMADDAMLYSALEESSRAKALITVHAESEGLLSLLISRYARQAGKLGMKAHALSRPNVVEEEAIHRVALWAESTGGNLYIVHVSSGEGAREIAAAKGKGVHIFGETCPQYLILDDSVFDTPEGYLYATCPQVKKPADSEALWGALSHGTIQVTATDSCTFTRAQKDTWNGDFRKVPYGLPGVETLLPLLYTWGVTTNKLSLKQLVNVTSTNPAKIFGLYPKKGTISPGSDADLVLIDPDGEYSISWKNLATPCDWSPYEGFKVRCKVEKTILRGKIAAESGRWTGSAGMGKFIRRKPFNPEKLSLTGTSI